MLRDFLEGAKSLEQIHVALQPFLDWDFSNGDEARLVRCNNLDGVVSIEVEDRHLCSMLRRYLAGVISDEALSHWAAFIMLADVFVPIGDSDEERWASGDKPLWDILQKLMTPSVFGKITPTVAESFLNQLQCRHNDS